MNIPLLNQIKEKIKEKPYNFAMGGFFKPLIDSSKFIPSERAHNCGTAACIAGWAITLNFGIDKPAEARAKAWPEIFNGKHHCDLGIEALNLTKEQASRLFYTEGWPYEFEQAYKNARSQIERNAVAIARIDKFIESNGEI